VLVRLDERIFECVDLFDTLQIDGEFGGRKVFSDYEIKEYDRPQVDWNIGVVKNMKKGVYLDWENNSIMKLNSYNLNVVPIGHNDDEFPL
jgi:hypothetical protein